MDNAETEFLCFNVQQIEKREHSSNECIYLYLHEFIVGYVVFKGLKNSEKEERVFFDDLYIFLGEWDIHDPAVHERRKIDEIL